MVTRPHETGLTHKKKAMYYSSVRLEVDARIESPVTITTTLT